MRKKAIVLLRFTIAAVFAVLFMLLGSCGAAVETMKVTGIADVSVSPSAQAAQEPSATAQPALTPVPTTTPEPAPSYEFIGRAVSMASDYVNIRGEDDINAKIRGSFPAGASAGVIEYTGEWARILYGNIEGYVSREYILEVKGISVDVPEGDWASVVINPTNLLPKDFEVKLADFENGKVDARILRVCEQMFADAKEDGISLRLVDAHRSREEQSEQYEKKVRSLMSSKGYDRTKAQTEAAKITARPGTSEHQTGLALDIVTPSYNKRNEGFAKTKAFRWLNENAHNYGFTLRYKKDKTSITKVIYEPWHWRFVGIDAAVDMKVSGQCLEEYYGIMD